MTTSLAAALPWWLVSLTAPYPVRAHRGWRRRRSRAARRPRFQLFATQAPDPITAGEHARAFFGPDTVVERVCSLVI